MEPIETVGVGLPQDPRHLRIEAVVRRRSVSRVHLEILRHSGHALPECLKHCRVGRLGRQHTTRQQHDAMAGFHGDDPTSDVDPGLSRAERAERLRVLSVQEADPIRQRVAHDRVVLDERATTRPERVLHGLADLDVGRRPNASRGWWGDLITAPRDLEWRSSRSADI